MLTGDLRTNILAAREKRAFLRRQCAAAGQGTLSLSLNIPGYPKCAPLFSACFDLLLAELKDFFLARRILLCAEQEIVLRDEAGDFYLAPLNPQQAFSDIKAVCENFEETHPLGRIIDVDLTEQQGNPISSHKLKRCFLCDNPAVVCMREQTHSYQALREHIMTQMQRYLDEHRKQQICKQLAALALKATLYEIALSPKPGLVDRFDCGAHRDMDYFTFLNSSAALAGYFEELARSGYTFQADNFRRALPRIRQIGLKMEAAMFHETGGVNTHKGLIFLLGLSIFACAYLFARQRQFQEQQCRQVIARICENLAQQELGAFTHQEQTHGSLCFREYGTFFGGARKEAQEGFPSVFEHGLPELRSQLAAAAEPYPAAMMNAALTSTLLRLMSVVNDTNILYRKDLATLNRVKQMAWDALKEKNPAEKSERYAELIAYCRREHVSPGGSADLLAVTLFFSFVEKLSYDKLLNGSRS